MDNVIKLKDVSVQYAPHVKGLNDLTLDIHSHDFVAVLGPNGAGKTTLLKVINGLLLPSAGEVKVLGQKLTKKTVPCIRKKIGFVEQNQNIDARAPITAKESVYVGAYGALGLGKRVSVETKSFVDEVMEYTGLHGLANKALGLLSGGEKQKVAIARALAQKAEILLLDEAANSLDAKAQEEIFLLIDDLYKKYQLTIVLVTHQVEQISTCCKRSVHLDRGSLITDERFN